MPETFDDTGSGVKKEGVGGGKHLERAMKIFEAIRNDDLEQVVACVEADPACVNAIAPRKPNDTKGMSPLQVALTTGWHRKIAWYLLEHGADVNFIEPPKIRKVLADPAFFDAAKVAVHNARRYERNEDESGYHRVHSREDADEAFAFLKAVVEHGADLKKTDYYGNGVISCVVFEAGCVYPDPKYPNRKPSKEQDEDLLRIFAFLLERGAEKSTFSTYARKTTAELYRGEPIWKLVGGLLEEGERGGSVEPQPESGKMEQYSEQDLQYAAEFREEIHKEALERLNKLHPEIGDVVDRWPVEAYFQQHWDYPGKWYTVVAIPEECKSRKALIDAIVSDTLKQHGISAGERKGYDVNAKKLDAKRYDYEKLFTVKVDQNNRSCTVVGKDDKGRYILEYYEEYNLGGAVGSTDDYYVLTDAEYKRYARMALANGHLTEADYDRLLGGDASPKAEALPAGDPFSAVLAEYPRCAVEYSIVPGRPSSCRGCEAHRLALKQAFRKYAEDGGEVSYDVIAARGKQIDAGKLFAPAREMKELNYRGAFLHPPQDVGYTDADFDGVNAALFPNGPDGLEVYEWTTDWSDFFDDGHEWWGALCLTVYDKSLDHFVVILASSTD